VRVLCLDAGSSSLKFAVYDRDENRERLREAGETAITDTTNLEDFETPEAIGHRIVFGGPDRAAPARIDDRLLHDLEHLRDWDPLHLDPQVAIVKAARRRFPGVPQVACFDTAFFQRLPPVATRLPLPQLSPRIRRYGFHGLSYEWALSTLDDPWGRVVIAHLGSGASLCAVLDGLPVETTMGFSVLGGLMMGTRPGDLDPGVLLELLRQGRSLRELVGILYEESGLKGVSEISGDMRALLAAESSNPRAAEAIALFVHQLRKHLGAMIAMLGGLDTLVFTGGIGENAAQIRARACEPFRYLGLHLSNEANERNGAAISADDSGVAVRVVVANENAMIARHVWSTMKT
jgi:acetate kinase